MLLPFGQPRRGRCSPIHYRFDADPNPHVAFSSSGQHSCLGRLHHSTKLKAGRCCSRSCSRQFANRTGATPTSPRRPRGDPSSASEAAVQASVRLTRQTPPPTTHQLTFPARITAAMRSTSHDGVGKVYKHSPRTLAARFFGSDEPTRRPDGEVLHTKCPRDMIADIPPCTAPPPPRWSCRSSSWAAYAGAVGDEVDRLHNTHTRFDLGSAWSGPCGGTYIESLSMAAGPAGVAGLGGEGQVDMGKPWRPRRHLVSPRGAHRR